MSSLSLAKHDTAKCCKRFRDLSASKTFITAFAAGVFSGTLGVTLRFIDVDMDFRFLKDYNPDDVVFNVFVVFASLVGSFRTAHALVRYTDAAASMHKLAACWYDATSTLFAYCRGSPAAPEDIKHFQETLLRLISLLNALCLDGLEQKESDFDSGHSFEVIGWKDFHSRVQDGVMNSHSKVEYAFQGIQQLIVDAMHSSVLSIAPPLLTRSIQELGAGLLIYHEAKKLSCVPLPFAYQFITRVILCCEAVYLPFVLAVHTKGHFSTFWFGFGGTVMLWFLNGVADSLDNPFRKEASTLETADVQIKLNVQLRELVRNAEAPTPSLRTEWHLRKGRKSASPQTMANKASKASISFGQTPSERVEDAARVALGEAPQSRVSLDSDNNNVVMRRPPRHSIDTIETSMLDDLNSNQDEMPPRPPRNMRLHESIPRFPSDDLPAPQLQSRAGWGLGAGLLRLGFFAWRGRTEEKARPNPSAPREDLEGRLARGDIPVQNLNMAQGALTARRLVMV